MFLISQTVIAQEYFVLGAGKYIHSSNFETNVQEDLSQYIGIYSAVTETYESSFTFEITVQDNTLNIILIYGATMGIEDNWEQDTSSYKGVFVNDGNFSLDVNVVLNPSVNEIQNFRFVKCWYNREEDNKKIESEGLVIEEYKMFAEKER